MRKRKSCSLKIKISKVLLCFKDKESDEMFYFGVKGALVEFWKELVLVLKV